MNFQTNQELYQLQIEFMNKKQRLIDLFDLFQASPCFSIPSNQPAINLENITFGPDQYTIEISDLITSNIRIIYYCLLYFTFEKNPQNEGLKVYQRLLEFIKGHNLTLTQQNITITNDQLKGYYSRFFFELFKAKCKRKLIIQELSTLPQIDILMKNLIQSITGQNDLIIQINASEIQEALLKVLGFEMEFLSSEIFIFQKTYVVEIRHYSKTCSFLVRHEKEENVEKIRQEINIGNSAFFFHEINTQFYGNRKSREFGTKRKFNVIKKSTVKSIGLSSSLNENINDTLDQQGLEFGENIFNEIEEKNLSLEDFQRKIINSLVQPLQTERPKNINQQKTEMKEQKKDKNKNSLFFEDKVLVNQFFTFQTEPERNQKKEHKKSEQESDLAASSIKSVNSTCSYSNYRKHSPFFEEKYNFSLRSKKHKDSFASTSNNRSFISSESLLFSHSTKLLKESEFDPEKQKKVKRERRVPAFVLNRQKAKQNKSENNILKGVQSGVSRTKTPQIVFSYKTSE